MDFSIFLQLPIHVQTGQDHCCDSQLLNEGDLGGVEEPEVDPETRPAGVECTN